MKRQEGARPVQNRYGAKPADGFARVWQQPGAALLMRTKRIEITAFPLGRFGALCPCYGSHGHSIREANVDAPLGKS